MGSPPHMRGTVDFFGFEFQEYKITPAHAGNRPRKNLDNCNKRDHPRTCGEQFFV